MSAPDVISLPGLIWGAVRRPARELWRSLREGDQAAMIGLLMQVAARARDPDAFYVDGRPFAPRILVVHSAAGLKAMASEPAIDKGPTASIAVAIGGDTDAYEPIMGQATSRSYQPQIGLVHAIIKQRQRGLRELVERRFDAHLAPPREVGLRAVQYYTASILLQTIFPAHEWSREEIVSLIDALEENALVVGPMAQNAALRGEAVSEILRSAAIRDAAGRYDALYARLAREEQLRQAELALPTDPTAESERQRLRGVATMFADAGLRWPDTKALATTLFSASYETVATSINELLYQLARHPELWAELAASSDEERKRLIKHAIYEAVRIINPLPMLLRRAERACTLRITHSDGSVRDLAVPARQLLLGLTLRPLRDPTLFPEPERLRLDLSPAQIEVIRLAWGVEPGSNAATENRFCKGLAYSITLMSRTLELLLDRCAAPELLVDAPVQMFGTQSRKRFRAQLSPRR